MIEKTVFISYRRADVAWALNIFQSLQTAGFDTFFDFNGLSVGDFESVLLENVRARAHFVVLLTPGALDRCNEPGDWLRREIEEALATRRNVVPVFLDGFDFGASRSKKALTGKLAPLAAYNGLRIHSDYFNEGMERLRDRLKVQLSAVAHPASQHAQAVAVVQQAAAAAAERPELPPPLSAAEVEVGDTPRRQQESAPSPVESSLAWKIRLFRQFLAFMLVSLAAAGLFYWIAWRYTSIELGAIPATTAYDQGVFYEEQGRFVAAAEAYRRAMVRGSPDACYRLAVMSEDGRNGLMSSLDIRRLYYCAAESGSEKALQALSRQGVSESELSAIRARASSKASPSSPQ